VSAGAGDGTEPDGFVNETATKNPIKERDMKKRQHLTEGVNGDINKSDQGGKVETGSYCRARSIYQALIRGKNETPSLRNCTRCVLLQAIETTQNERNTK